MEKSERQFREALKTKRKKQDFNFAGVHFPGYFSAFKSFCFHSNVNFYHAVFEKKADFSEAIFDKEAKFSHAVFEEEADFSKVTFNEDANFRKATFKNDADFDRAIFKKEADFRKATFKGSVEFKEPKPSSKAYSFYARANFSMANFEKQARFIGPSVFNTEQPESTFRDALIEKPENFSLDRVHLRPSWFIDTNVRHFRFTDVQWRGLPGELKDNIKSEIKAIQVRRPGKDDPREVLARACRELSTNAEENHDYPTANDFHFLAMETGRKDKFRGFVPWRLRWWYWLLSGYGDRPLWAFLWILGIWLFFAALYTIVGFPQTQSTGQQGSQGELLSVNFWQALISSLGVITLQVKALSGTLGWAHSLVVVEGIVGPLLVALFVLALRRKFMR
jgi:hypothetical protein